jgi:uncharacterized membrane protein YfcA
MSSWIVVLIIFILAILMTMSGRGGGNFYVAALVLSKVPMHTASTTSQFILLASSLTGALVFGKAKEMSWHLVLFFGGINATSAFFGGFLAHMFGGTTLKIVLSILLFLAGVAMLFPEKQGHKIAVSRFGFWNIRENDNLYVINLWVAVPLTIATGFFSGMVGISGGSFLVPLMVVGCGVPVRTAVGTATTMLSLTALTGFTGNALHGGFAPGLAIPCGIVAVVGGLIGSKIALKTKPKILKTISGILTIIAAIIMLLNALHGK